MFSDNFHYRIEKLVGDPVDGEFVRRANLKYLGVKSYPPGGFQPGVETLQRYAVSYFF
jgi:hypothetical protein